MRHRGRILVLLVAVLVTAGACSSSSGSHSAQATTASTSAGSTGSSASSAGSSASGSGSPIKVGFVCSCSGNPIVAENVPVEDVYKLWADNVNASGGVDGHPIQVITEDDKANPGNALSAAQQLISDHVSAIVDNSVVDQSWASTVQAAGIPVVGVITNGAPFTNNPDFYPEAQTNDSVLFSIATIAKQFGGTKIANFYCLEAAQCAQTVPLLKTAAKQVGIDDAYNTSISATAPNYTAQCVAAKQAGVNVLFLVDAASINVHVASDCAQQGYFPKYVVEGDGFGLQMVNAPGTKNNTYVDFTGYPFFGNTPVLKTLDAAMDKAYPGVRQNPNLWSQNAVLSWSAGILLEDALKAGGLASGAAPTPAEVVKGLQSLKGDTLQGMAAPLTFSAGNKPHLLDCWFVGALKNGAPTVLNGGRATCLKPGS